MESLAHCAPFVGAAVLLAVTPGPGLARRAPLTAAGGRARERA
jgi:threonine/homoserine/homoserine lactone efflux protein